jgi:MFS family permease
MTIRLIRMRFRPRGLWRRPDFLRLWAGQTVSKAGSLVTGFALPLTAILALHASAAQVALLGAAGVAPGLVLGLAAGVWVDRVRRRPLLIAADLGRAVVVGSVPVATLLGRLAIEQLYLVALFSSALTVLFEVAYPAYLASLVRTEELVEANSKLEASSAVAEAAGFGAAGALVQALTAPLALAVDAGSYVVSALTLTRIRAREPVPVRADAGVAREGKAAQESQKTEGTHGESVWRQLGGGLRLTLTHPVARSLVLASGMFELCGNVLGVVLLLYLVREVHLGAALLGVLFGIGGVSAFAGSLVAARAARRWGIGRVVIGGLAIYTASAIVLPLASGPVWLAAALLTVGQFTDCAHTVYSIGKASLLQALVPAGSLGRLHASVHVVEAVATLTGIALGGVLGQTIGPRPTLFAAVVGGLLAPLVLARSPLRHMRTLPAVHAEGLQSAGIAGTQGGAA